MEATHRGDKGADTWLKGQDAFGHHLRNSFVSRRAVHSELLSNITSGRKTSLRSKRAAGNFGQTGFHETPMHGFGHDDVSIIFHLKSAVIVSGVGELINLRPNIAVGGAVQTEYYLQSPTIR